MSQKPSFTIDLDEGFPRLNAAPIEEAIIHWQAQAVKWPSGTLLQQKLQEIFTEYPDYAGIQEFTAQTGAENGTSTDSRSLAQWKGLRLRNSENTYAAQFTSQGVIFSRLAPYEHWDSFKNEAKRFWDAFLEIAEPVSIQRLGVRYINRIQLDSDEEPAKYVRNVKPYLPKLNAPVETFFYQDVYRIPDHPYLVNWICTREQSPSPDTPQGDLILDIDVFADGQFLLDEGTLELRLKEMRWLKDKVFFSCITEDAIKAFGG
jgi:uncharacterized protein (TIGR04255 family)